MDTDGKLEVLKESSLKQTEALELMTVILAKAVNTIEELEERVQILEDERC
jgi:hypothetical protein